MGGHAPYRPEFEARLSALRHRAVAVVRARLDEDPTLADPLRGLYLDAATMRSIVDGVGSAPRDSIAGPGGGLSAQGRDHSSFGPAFAGLAARAGLDALDIELLVAAAAPDLDPAFERLYGYLHDDVTRRRASAGLAFALAGADPTDPLDRRRLDAGGPLRRLGLLEVEEPDRPFLTRGLRVPDAVVATLLDDPDPDPLLTGVVVDARPWPHPLVDRLAAAIGGGVRLTYLREPRPATARQVATAAIHQTGGRALCLDLHRLAGRAGETVLTAAARQALLGGAILVAGPIDDLGRERPDVLHQLTIAPAVVVLTGAAPWDPAWSGEPPLAVDAPVLSADDRAERWRDSLGAVVAEELEAHGTPYRLGLDQIPAAAATAQVSARFWGRPVSPVDVTLGVRSLNGRGLDRLARRLEPAARWADLVLAPEPLGLLHELAARLRHRSSVLDEWGLRRGGRGEGITALFAGGSGTGKTLACEVIAAELGLDLYTVDLATVVDKYIGETEKNLDRIFAEAEQVNAVLFFDEADALFGKRSEVRDARDRYANVEVAYLLQRMERFDGLAVLATNLRANLDEAFARRLDLVIDFPDPDEPARLALWRHLVGNALPLADDVDLSFCAKAFELSGGNIRNVVVTAAYLAAEDGTDVTMRHLVLGVQREFRKLGRLCVPSEFGAYAPLVTGTSGTGRLAG